MAILLAVAAYLLVSYGLDNRLPSQFAEYAVLFAGGYLWGHLLIRRFAPRADPAFFPTAGLLVGIGFAMIHRISEHGPTGDIAPEQALWLVVGLIAFTVTLTVIRDIRQLDAFTYTGWWAWSCSSSPSCPGSDAR
jgi:hypothetical protein